MIEFENGFHESHDRSDPVEQEANLRWFQQQWDRLAIGACLMTSVGSYLKTEKGFRRLTDGEDKANMQAIIEKRGYAVIGDDQGMIGVITNGAKP